MVVAEPPQPTRSGPLRDAVCALTVPLKRCAPPLVTETVTFVGARHRASRSFRTRSQSSSAKDASHRSTSAVVASGDRKKFFDAANDLYAAWSLTGSACWPVAMASTVRACASSAQCGARRWSGTAASSPAVLTPSSSLSRRPRSPPRPARRSSGKSRRSPATWRGKTTVCWFGLCRPHPSLASCLFGATPPEHVKPSSSVTALRARDTTTAAASSSRSPAS
mmetsp:Transcript_29593/g.88435  ORF Transcript_29593/g.88435 Transcript_29593/m.88435 type:complete len:222 (+) Transcript_29593:158-823(+)